MKRITALVLTILLLLSFSACNASPKDAHRHYYEIFVRSFYDSDGDGSGDLKGITAKLDYLTEDLGVDGLWLMPIMPSPSYHKYDVTDYTAIDPQYGTMADFDALMTAAEKQQVTVILDLVLNHTSAQHPWFISAVKSLGIPPCGAETCTHPELCRNHNPYVTYYNFSQENKGAGWHTLRMPAGWSYEGHFWDQMPDLNLDDPKVREELLTIAAYWIERGVDGFRLDAVLHFYEGNAEKNVAFLQWFESEIKALNPAVYLVGEAWTEEALVTRYYESGIDSLFNFSLSGPTGAIAEAIRTGNAAEMALNVANYQQAIKTANPNAIDALFLSNHDQARSAGFLMADQAKQKLAASFYQLLPGNSFIYYGEEIGLFGSGKDENKRLPMIWSMVDQTGQTTPVAGSDAVRQIPAGVMEQLKDKNSLLTHYQKLISLKKRQPTLMRGELDALEMGDPAIAAFSVTDGDGVLYVIHNFSPEAKTVVMPETISTGIKLEADLSTQGEPSSFKNGILILQGLSSAVLK